MDKPKLSPKIEKQIQTMDDKNQTYVLSMLENLDKRMAQEKAAQKNTPPDSSAQKNLQ